MTKGLKEGEPNGRDMYPDIIDHPHHQSASRSHMSLYDRAAQFSSFAALVGYDDMVAEEARVTDREIELGDYEKEILSQKLNLLSDMIDKGEAPTVSLTYFVPDKSKAGGEYVTTNEEIKKIDTIFRKVVLVRTEGPGKINVEIDIDRIINISGDHRLIP